jgi:hypothetical protein
MSNRDGLRRHADVLERVADQLSAQLHVERWSNAELRKLLGETLSRTPVDEERGAACRLLTFACVAVATAASVALLSSSPWRGRDTLPTPAIAEPVVGAAMHGTIIPFTVIDVPPPPKSPPGALPGARFPVLTHEDIELVFGNPAAQIRPTSPSRQRGLFVDPREILPERDGSASDVP